MVARSIVPIAPIRARSVAAGVFGAATLLLVYLGIITLAQGVEHAIGQMAADALVVGLIAVGFGTQIVLFVELRAVGRHHRASAAVTAASTGTSGAAMLACCAHHVADLLPLLGLSTAAVFLNAYKTPLFLLGISMNVIGIVVIARRLDAARQECAMAEGHSSTA